MSYEEEAFEEDEIADIDVTPMVNLGLVLVMIFLVTSPYFVKDLIPVILPQAVSSESENMENITISISPTEGYFINEIPIRKRALRHLLQRALNDSHKKYILIRADERVPHGEIEDVLKITKSLGVRKIAFATVPKI